MIPANRFILIMTLVFIISLCRGQAVTNTNPTVSQKIDTVILPMPDLQKGKALMKVLKNRKSERSFSDKELDLQQISELLWSANGINRDDGKRTAPAAVNVQFVDIYVVTQQGVFLYDALKSRLIPIVSGDFRKDCGSQDFVSVAALNLVYVADFQKSKNLPAFAANASKEMKLQWAYLGAGAQSQNANLYCASEGLGAVVRTSINGETFGKLINIKPEQVVLLAQTIGYIK
jgi:nitroreductase